MSVVGCGVSEGYLTPDALASVFSEGLGRLAVDGRRVLVLIPDGTRTMPMPTAFDAVERELGPRVAALDFMVALGTHPPLSDAQLGRLIGRGVENGKAGKSRILNHHWDDPAAFANLGTIPAAEVAELTAGRLRQDVPVKLNKLILEYDHILVCGPVFPHEVAGFSGGTKYLFPGIAGAEIIHFTHWLGALITSYEIIGTRETPVRAVIDRAARLVDRPLSLLGFVVSHDGVAGVYCGEIREAWAAATTLSAHRHITWVERPYRRVLSVMPSLYDDLWTAAKGMYKAEPAVADGGEVIIYAPSIDEISYVHGRLIDEVGYHCRDYFVKQWDRFKGYPGGILAHSTHLKGKGSYDAATGVEAPRIQVTLATGIPAERCRKVNLGYLDPATIDPKAWQARGEADVLVVPRAGERLFRVGRPPDLD
jgi:nickel-dependent lactate racemase